MKKVLIAAFGILILAGCYNDKEDQLYPVNTGNSCDTTTVTYAATIMPIMTQQCATSACHDAATASSGYNLSNYAGVKLCVEDGKMLGCINWKPGFAAMPKGMAKMDNCTINKITRWINLGALNN